MALRTALRRQLARRAPRLDDAAARAAWKLRNRDRAYESADAPSAVAPLVERLRRDGVLITNVGSVFSDGRLFEEAATEALRLYEEPREHFDAAAGSKATFLTKLATGSYPADHPFVRLALHPNALAIANGYLELRSTLRALDLWLTRPTAGPAIQTQLWHRDGDDVMNVKMFVYFTDVKPAAGPLMYAPRTHPLGSRRRLPEHDEAARSTDEQLAQVSPRDEWMLCEGSPGTVVFADTCGYHKQLKPEAGERLLLVSHYVSGTPFVPRTLELRGVNASSLSDDEHVAVFDRPR
jgi:hypothetical protein